MEKTCVTCGTPFEPVRSASYCSDTCRAKASRERRAGAIEEALADAASAIAKARRAVQAVRR